MTDVEALHALAVAAAEAGAEELRRRFRSRRSVVESKSSSTDMVTDADRASEAAVLEVIRQARPDDAILAEETGAHSGGSGLRWVVDPLDGTTNFLYGIAQFCVSVAVEDAEGGLVGCIVDPIAGERFTGVRGGGATLNGAPIRVSESADLARSLLATGFSYLAEEREDEARMLPFVLPAVRDIRRQGSAALDLAQVACGRVDGYFEVPTFPWDVAAGTVIVRAAGGVTSPLEPIRETGGLVAAAPGIHADLVALLARARDAAGLGA